MKRPGEHLAFVQHDKRVEIADPAELAERVILFSESTLELVAAARKWADDLEALTQTFQVLDN